MRKKFCLWIVCVLFGGTAQCLFAETPAVGSTNLVVDLGGGVTMEFVPIQAGSFIMGSEKTTLLDQKPAHRVTISEPFHLGKFEVTQEQWTAIMSDTTSIHKGPRYPDCAKYPAENVSWKYCHVFLDRLNKKVSDFEFRLPTEAEWEYACRAGKTNDFNFGDDVSVCGQFAWYSANADGQPRPVGQKKPNRWGLYDMHGNVWEWCGDIYQAYPGGTLPQGVGSGTSRVLRGGAYNTVPRHLSSSYRHDLEPQDCGRYYGFRCVAVARPKPQ